MNTQAQVHRLEAGQALPLPRRSAGPAVLTQGELLVQQPAHWLGETVVVSAPMRLVAPAVLPGDDSWSVVAVRPSSVTVQVAEPRLVAGLPAFANWLRDAASLRGHFAG